MLGVHQALRSCRFPAGRLCTPRQPWQLQESMPYEGAKVGFCGTIGQLTLDAQRARCCIWCLENLVCLAVISGIYECK
jgi:hypothetical protein